MGSDCDAKDIALKSMFFGPHAENGPWVRKIFDEIFEEWFKWRRSLFPADGKAISDSDQASPEFIERRERLSTLLRILMDRFEDEIPKFSPRYIGHMFSESSLPALLGHFVTLLHNPNNVSAESSRVGVELETEAVTALLTMVGYSPTESTGHFTSGGTVANFEALVRAKQRMALWLSAGAQLRSAGASTLSLCEAAHMGWKRFDTHDTHADLRPWNFSEANPYRACAQLEKIFDETFNGPVVLVPGHKHYSWPKGVSLLGLGNEALWPIALDACGKLSIPDLRQNLEKALRERRPVLMVVSVAGTTEMGGIDPIHEVQGVLDEYRTEKGLHIWHHVDAAYGGFFCCLELGKDSPLNATAAQALAAIGRSNSVTLDPHKLGYVPYSSGTFLAKCKRDYFVKPTLAPYLDFKGLVDRGPFTIEGSRSAAGAVATWMTANSIGLNSHGYGRLLARTIKIRRDLEAQLTACSLPIRIAPFSDSNILCFTVAKDGEALSVSNQRTLGIFEALSGRANGDFFVSKTILTRPSYGKYLDSFVASWKPLLDSDSLVLVRLCLMNPFFDSREISVDYGELFVETLLTICEGAGDAH